jgi:hypothetical protein
MPDRLVKAMHAALRGYVVLLIVVAGCAAMLLLNPAKLLLLIWLGTKGFAGLYAGYWGDRFLFPDDQPENLSGIEKGAAWKRQAWIIAAFVVAAGLLP